MTDTHPLPQIIPVFPLTGAVLLPRGVLPLNIFEPRYLAMVRDAMAGPKLIAMVQPRDENTPQPLFEVGCVGQVTEYRETEDGRMMIELTGLQRFKIERELDVSTPYRQIIADYAGFDGDRAEPLAVNPTARAALEQTLRAYLDENGLSADWEAVSGADDDSLITTLACVCPFDPVEKQALLEAADLPTRAATLMALMSFSTGFGDEGGTLQ